jgi:hypothetical protein
MYSNFAFLLMLLTALVGIGGAFGVVFNQVNEKKRRAKKGVICPECGKKLPDDSSFCEYCGAALPANYDVRISVKWLYFVLASGLTLGTCYLVGELSDCSEMHLQRISAMPFLALCIVAICALIQALRMRLHWHDCLVVWAFLAILTLPRFMYVNDSVLEMLTILLILYYLIFNAVTHYLHKH